MLAPQRAKKDPAVVSLRSKLVEGAKHVLGKPELVVRGKRFTMDCTGTVLAIYWYAGVDLAKDFGLFTGSGVVRLYKSLERKGLLNDTGLPLSGDLIFWDNTFDENGDGLWNDALTHVGMVMSTAVDGTISYVHDNTDRGIVIEYMNLSKPGVYQEETLGRGKTINSPMRLAVPGRPHPPKWLSGQLYRIMGMGYLMENRLPPTVNP
jgi:hypothetical protein